MKNYRYVNIDSMNIRIFERNKENKFHRRIKVIHDIESGIFKKANSFSRAKSELFCNIVAK